MDKQTYESLIESEIQSAIARLLPHGGGATVTEVRLRSALDTLTTRIASHTRSYELMGIRNSEELAAEWGISVRGVRKHIAALHKHFGIGRKVGRDWLLSTSEAESHRPPGKGRPRNAG